MGNSNKEMKFSGFYADDGTYVPFINNRQVDFCVLLRNVNKNNNGCLDNYEVVRNIITIPTVFGKTSTDVFTGEKYQFCRIVNDNKRRYLVANGNIVSPEYVLVSFKEYYYRSFLFDKLDASSDNLDLYDVYEDMSSKIFEEWDRHMLNEMYKTFQEQKDNLKTRTR